MAVRIEAEPKGVRCQSFSRLVFARMVGKSGSWKNSCHQCGLALSASQLTTWSAMNA